MTDDQVHSALCDWLESIAKIPVIMSHQGGPTPADSYIVVNLTGTAEVREWSQTVEYEEPQRDTGEEFGEVTATPPIETEWRFSVHAYGQGPTSILRPVRAAAQLAQKNEPMMPGLIVHECSQVRNVPDWINEKWEPRAQIDIFVRGIARDGFLVDVIEKAPFDFDRTH